MSIQVRNHRLSIHTATHQSLLGIRPLLSEASEYANVAQISETQVRFNSENGLHQDLIIDKLSTAETYFISLNLAGIYTSKADEYLGIAIEQILDFSKGVAFYNYPPVKAWTHPQRINHISDLEYTDNQFFLWTYSDGTYAAALPMCGNGYVASVGRVQNALAVRAYNYVDGEVVHQVPLLAIAFGTNPYCLIEQLISESLCRMGRADNRRAVKKFPEIFESLAWCTWNAWGHAVDEFKILESIHSFQAQGIAIPTVLIDDGWMTVNGAYGSSALAAFEPNADKFPSGFKTLIQQLKSQYQVQHVGVWHTLNGYWAGVDIQSSLGKKYQHTLTAYIDKVTWTNDEPRTFYTPSATSQEGQGFYADWYQSMKADGVDFVKIDNQLILDRIARNNRPYWDTATQVQTNVQNAVKEYFDNTAIHCMGLNLAALFNLGTSAVVRAEEDYLPSETSYSLRGGNAASHVLCATYNALWVSPMAWTDADMFQTHHPHAVFHAVARMMSAGPVYITDVPNCTNIEIIKALCLSNGTLLRPDAPALPTLDVLFELDKPFKTFTKVGATGLLAVYHTCDTDDRLEVSLRPTDVDGIEGEQFLVYEFFSQQTKLLSRDEVFKVYVARMEVQLFYIIPLEHDTALIGLHHKYNAPKTIHAARITEQGISLLLKEAGDFRFYTQRQVQSIAVNGTFLPTQEYTCTDGLFTLSIPATPLVSLPLVEVVFVS